MQKKSNLRFIYIRVNLLILKYIFIHNYEPHTLNLISSWPIHPCNHAALHSETRSATKPLTVNSWLNIFMASLGPMSYSTIVMHFLNWCQPPAQARQRCAHTVNKKLVTYSLIQTGILTHALHHSLASLFLSCFFALSSLTTLAVFRSFWFWTSSHLSCTLK